MRILKIYRETTADGPGFRYSIYFSGCLHGCVACHNKQSWDFEKGAKVNKEGIEKIIDEINGNPMLDGITISGGDPMFSAGELLPFLRELKEGTGKNIWCYTGFTLEEIEAGRHKGGLGKAMWECLKYIDVLVDGKFQETFYDPELYYRGSKNQRIIKVKEYLEEGKIISMY
jgi:anaerobic ribonucleoside-triphosphate reductase activating protein